MTLDRYGHLYKDDLDAVGAALIGRYQAAATTVTSSAAARIPQPTVSIGPMATV